MTMRLIAALEAFFHEHQTEHPPGASVMPTVPHAAFNDLVAAANEAHDSTLGQTVQVALNNIVQVQRGMAKTAVQFAAGDWHAMKTALADEVQSKATAVAEAIAAPAPAPEPPVPTTPPAAAAPLA